MSAGSHFHSARRAAPAWAIGLGCFLSVASLVRGAEMADLVRSYGLSSVDPPRPAADFTLPRRGGGEASLSDFQGEWVILTFWASWCAPCRAEMPSLDRLHRARSGSGITVLGVSVDRDRVAARTFADELDLSFPLLWDEAGRVGAVYQATAIPISFLVDPGGRIVAMARGARDWTRFGPLMDSLVEAASSATATPTVYAEAVELPGVLQPPTAEVRLSNPSPVVGEEFALEIRLRWDGRLEEYLPQPPSVQLPDGLVRQGVTASTDSRQGSQVVLYRVHLEAEEAGSYALDPVELSYRPRFATSDTAARVAGPTVEVRTRTLAGLRPVTLALGAGAFLVAAVLGLAAGRRRWAARSTNAESEETRFERLAERFNDARSLRIQGDGAGFALAMLDLERELRGSDERDSMELAGLEESLRYGGVVPPTDELDRLQRAVERRFEAARPDPEAAARGALRLRQGERVNQSGLKEK